ncbi:Integrase zinc binding domain [Popillia japonica]|uniref:RNA-directed DNA polymerase n=1 Tax=Popillia japonica TaxID=7064 RepID=A0AAW1MBG4_POPJA
MKKKDINPGIMRWSLVLQNYNYSLEHKRGNIMQHVDALSRCHSVLIIEENTLETNLILKQSQDREITELRRRLEEKEDKNFELRNGLVYKKDKDRLLFYVPDALRGNIIRTCHDDVGHVGIDKCTEFIRRTYWFPRMRDKVKEHIANCLKCIAYEPKSGKEEGFLHSIPKGNIPFNTIHIDHYGPLEKTTRNNRYIFEIIDGFSKFIRFFPYKTTKSEEVIKHLQNYFRSYSKPTRIVSDRGTCFTSNQFKEFINDEAITHVLIATNTPRANGQIERYNRTLTSMLSKLSGDPTKWDEVLDKVEFAMNDTVCRSTGLSPSTLLIVYFGGCKTMYLLHSKFIYV